MSRIPQRPGDTGKARRTRVESNRLRFDAADVWWVEQPPKSRLTK